MTVRPVVAVIGPGDGAPDELCQLARQLGRLLAGHGAVVVTGGLGGVMAGAARGVSEAGGLVLGLLPGDDRAAADEYLSVAIPTGLGEARNAVIVAAADAFVAVGGSWGTLSEIALARRAGKPVVSLCGWQLRDGCDDPIPLLVAASPEHAMALLVEALGR